MSFGRFRGAAAFALVWLALALGAGRDAYASASRAESGIPDMIRSYIGAAADTISLPPLGSGRTRALVFLPRRGGPGVPLDRIGRPLWSGPRAAILEYDPARSRELTAAYEILPFPGEAVLTRPRLDFPPPLEPDPRIAAAVEEVDSVRCLDTAADLVAFGSRRSDGPGGFDAGAYILDRFRSIGLTDASYFDYNDWCDDVVAVQPGLVWPDRIYVIGAHYDSINRDGGGEAPGADDNASGTAGLLEVARVLSRVQFESTIIYIAFSGEEQGLVGSGAWASWAAEHGLDIRAMVNLDMIGYVAPGDIADLDLITNGLYPDLEAFTTATVGLYLPDFPVVSGHLDWGTSDQASFWGIDVPAIFFFEDSDESTPFIHTADDRIGASLNNPGFMRRNAQSAAAVIATLASPIRVRIAHVPVVDPSEGVALYRLRAQITSLAPLVDDSLYVRYRVDGGPLEFLHLEADGDSGSYETAIPRQPAGSRVEYWIHARDEDGVTGDDPPGAPEEVHEFEVGTVAALSDRFDQDCGWTVGAPDDSATTGIWIRGVPIGTGAQPGADADGDTAGFCFFTGNGSPGGPIGEQDVDGGRTSLTSPRFDLAGRARVTLEYARWFVDETRPDDTLRVFISNDDGASWRLVEKVGDGERLWKTVRIDSIDSLMPMTDRMRMRFVAEDRGGASLVEAAIDDFRIRAARAPAPALGGRPVSALLVGAAPNPFRTATAVICDLAANAEPVIRVFDARGRRVAVVSVGARGPGRSWIRWDGRDGHGRDAPAGVYFLRLESPGATQRPMRVVKLR